MLSHAPGELFTVFEPTADETAVLVEVPHAGLEVDALASRSLIAPEDSLRRDADLYVDELYQDAPAEGASFLVSHVSRYVCDLNRSERDVDALAVVDGTANHAPHGLIWRTTTDDLPAIRAPLDRAEFTRRINSVYRPYHETLMQLLEAKRRRFGFVILLCGHSMPSQGRAGHDDPGRGRADVVPGSRSHTSAALDVINAPAQLAGDYGWSVLHDDPYRGGYSTYHYGRPNEEVHAVQVELARRLYMDEVKCTKKPLEFEKVRGYCRALVARLGALDVT